MAAFRRPPASLPLTTPRAASPSLRSPRPPSVAPSLQALLEALAGSIRFRNDLKDTPLGQCKVCVLRGVAGKKPTAKEEAGAIEVEGADTIGEALQAARQEVEAAGHTLPAADKIFVRVRLPGAMSSAESECAVPLARPCQRLVLAARAASRRSCPWVPATRPHSAATHLSPPRALPRHRSRAVPAPL